MYLLGVWFANYINWCEQKARLLPEWAIVAMFLGISALDVALNFILPFQISFIFWVCIAIPFLIFFWYFADIANRLRGIKGINFARLTTCRELFKAGRLGGGFGKVHLDAPRVCDVTFAT